MPQYRDRGYDDYGRETTSVTNTTKQLKEPTATLDKIDDYMELLYGSMKEKISGTASIVELARDASNLEILSSNNSLMSALARVLKADYKHNIGLSTNIMYVWFSFSNFSQLHGVLTTRRIGSDTIKVIDLEIRRERLRQRELQTKTRIANIQARGGEVPENLWEELAGRTSKGKDGVIDAGSKEDHPLIDIDRERKMTKHLIRKQDKLLFVCFHILLNLAEDVTIEKKMVKKSISGYLTAALGRSSAELLILTVTFLKKLSIFQTGTLSMIDKGIVPRLVTFIPCSNARLMKLTLRLLWNLSFNGTLREQMMTAGLIPKLVKLLEHKEFRSVAIKMLYHMSKDDESKSKIAFSGAIPWVMQLIMKWPAGKIVEELGALAVNLSHSSAGCDFMCQDGGLKILLQRSARHRDAVLMKVVRNISHWTYNKVQPEDEENGPGSGGSSNVGSSRGAGSKSSGGDAGGKEGDVSSRSSSRDRTSSRRRGRNHGSPDRSVWQPFVHDLFKLCLSCASEDEDMFVEVLGVIGNLTRNDLPDGTTFSDLIEKYDLVEFLSRHLVPGMSQDDVVLNIIIIVGTFAVEREAARIMVGSPLIRTVHDIMRSKSSDNEIVLQTMYSFGHILNHPDTWEMLVFETSIVNDLCKCTMKKCLELRGLADQLLAYIMELCTPKPKKKKKKKGKNGGARRRGKGRRGRGRDRRGGDAGGKNNRGSEDSATSSSEDSEESESEEDSEDSEAEGKYSPSRSMDEMDLSERQKVEKWNKIRKARFEAHNREWMMWAREEMKIEDDGVDYDDGDEDYGRYRKGVSGSGTGGMGDGYGDLDDSGQWMNAGMRQENIAYDMSLLGGEEGREWEEGKESGYY